MPSRSWTDQQLISATKNGVSYADVCRDLGLVVTNGNYRTLKKHIDRLQLDTTHFEGSKIFKKGNTPSNKKELKDILKEGVSYQGSRLKRRLISEGLKQDICEQCGQLPIHNHKKLVLQLDHKNGNHTDNRLENLQVVCPNCHSQTNNYGSKNKRWS